MQKDAASATFLSRVFYITIHAFVLLIIFTYENSLRQSCSEFVLDCYLFFSLKILAIYLFFSVDKMQSIVTFSTELDPVEWSRPPQPFCETCNLTTSFRTKHCKKCEKCISVFDHHCFWVGCCVGELNHFRFFLFLAVESICVWWLFFSSFSGLVEGTEGYGAFVVNIALMGVFGLFVGGMGIFHFYLISAGSTTWEFLSRYKIEYLKLYPRNFNPFSFGFIQNWKHAATVKIVSIWDLPQPLYVYPFNWCDNEYWSCC